jgi:hypothetical protein
MSGHQDRPAISDLNSRIHQEEPLLVKLFSLLICLGKYFFAQTSGTYCGQSSPIEADTEVL